MQRIAAIIPSFNSSRFIVKLIKEILRERDISQIVVVDDSSPDGTFRLVEKKFGRNKRVKLIVRRKKGGRGSAVVEGFTYALKNKNIDFLIEMDADFAHKPSDIPRFIEKASEFDAVFGSRYLKNGGTINYSLPRRIFSFLANSFISLILGISITDYTSGFRCYKRLVLESIDLSSIRSRGFIALSEIAYKIHKKGLRIGEIPIKVVYFEENESNFNFREIADAFVGILKIRFAKD